MVGSRSARHALIDSADLYHQELAARMARIEGSLERMMRSFAEDKEKSVLMHGALSRVECQVSCLAHDLACLSQAVTDITIGLTVLSRRLGIEDAGEGGDDDEQPVATRTVAVGSSDANSVEPTTPSSSSWSLAVTGEV